MVGEDVAQRLLAHAGGPRRSSTNTRTGVARASTRLAHPPPRRADRPDSRARRRAGAGRRRSRSGSCGSGAPGRARRSTSAAARRRRRSSSGRGTTSAGPEAASSRQRVAEQRDGAAGVGADLRVGDEPLGRPVASRSRGRPQHRRVDAHDDDRRAELALVGALGEGRQEGPTARSSADDRPVLLVDERRAGAPRRRCRAAADARAERGQRRAERGAPSAAAAHARGADEQPASGDAVGARADASCRRLACSARPVLERGRSSTAVSCGTTRMPASMSAAARSASAARR